jgi:hypothetical protein
MAKEVSLKIVADASKATEAAKGLKQQLKEATKEAQALVASGDTSSKAYKEAAKRVAELKDQLQDFNDEVKALDPGQKFQTIAGVATSIAGGFQAAQGAMALFGAESKDVEKALLKVQAATALAQGIDQVREFGKYFGLAKDAIGNSIKSLFTLRGALIATGIGAFSVAVGVLIANWKDLVSWIDKTFPALGGLGNLFDRIKKIAMGSLGSIIESFKVVGEVIGNVFKGEFSKAVDVAGTFGTRVSQAYTKAYIEENNKQAAEREAKLLEGMIKTHEREVKLIEAQGKDSYAAKKKLLEEELKLLEFQKTKESNEYKDKYLELQILEIEHQKKISDIKKKAEEKATADFFNNLKLEYEKQQGLNQIKEDAAKIDEDRNKKTLENVTAFANKKIEIATFDAEKQKEIVAERNKQIFNEEIAIANARLQVASDITNGLTALGNAFIKDQKKLEKFNKAAALIQIGIDTAKAISALVAASNANPANAVTFGGAGIAQFGAGLAQILTNIAKAKQILSSSSSGSSTPTLGGGGGIPSAGGSNMPQTNAPGGFTSDVSGQRVTNQSGEGANQQGQFRVYVLESDITATQDGVAGIKRKAKVM